MPEYLAPGVFVEEVGFRAHAIEGVPTATTGFVGPTRWGPIAGAPRLVTSFAAFEREFGDDAALMTEDGARPNHLAHAVRLFFANGGRRLHVARVFGGDADAAAARSPALRVAGADRFLRACHPGRAGNLVLRIRATRSANLLRGAAPGRSLAGLRAGDLVELGAGPAKPRLVAAAGPEAPDPAALCAVALDAAGRPVLVGAAGEVDLDAPNIGIVQRISLGIAVLPRADGSTGTRRERHVGLSPHPDAAAYLGRVLCPAEAEGPVPAADRRVWLDAGALSADAAARAGFAAELALALIAASPIRLSGGADGAVPDAAAYRGGGEGEGASGLVALEQAASVELVAAAGAAALPEPEARAVREALIAHAERMRHRMAILAGPETAGSAAMIEMAALHDSGHAALFHPWLKVPGPGGAPMPLGPEGAIAGLIARHDAERGVHRSPANAPVLGILGTVRAVTEAEQDILTPGLVNPVRFFPDRGHVLYGARTLSRDPEWRYVTTRRLLSHLGQSIERGTQWVVFEPNGEALWQRLRGVIADFLHLAWRNGMLQGAKPEEAFFVRCDRGTMSQADLDEGRLVCLVGVAPLRPAEFVILRIGQWTADAAPR
jgi:phage tail sheath protein FI